MRIVLFACFALIALVAAADSEDSASPRVALDTSKGRIVLELFADKAPLTVAQFLATVESGFYDGTVFHRVIKGFMVQGGGFSRDMRLKPTDALLQNEADNGLKNTRGTVAMARKPDPHSASVQFFINTVDNTFLNHTSKSPQGWGYAVFAAVVEGMDVVDAIAEVPTGQQGGMGDVPREPVMIERATVLGGS
jgi:cyclophilin family peptidyl-prolyl cis-trans isomerase